ncbi:4-hydroxy-tetrahydrodipicolinate synthase [uncultured spirochete]|jgi:4-hydroxy-tetrahydrodipicolinate synthase|uniref:4-hydroxy-tetrahydrodipicolinate synthase n=1 Tax=uncultured spirochete TaxID=156406 RepID=A0A3P3XIX2_9SPIR|nr:4-hydroxy-tetrahydrodipicolinate synthase [Rectinema subterraneum]SLM12971.1 4-hydroxy-tetrahydrodipicolinate synthase [uncultured spirochete]
MVKDFGRILLPLITPFDKNEEVDYDKYKQLARYALEKNYCDSIIVTGTTGEFNTLSFDERVNLLEAALEAVDGKVPVIAGVGCASTRETVALAQKAEKLGADCLMVVAPFYCKPTQDAVYAHFKAVHDATNISILLYNIPIFTGINMEPALVGKLAALSRIIGIKDEAGLNPIQITDYYLATKQIKPGFLLYNGDDLMLMPTIPQGAIGIVSGGAHLVGDRIRKVFDLYEAGKNAEATEVYRDIFRLFRGFGVNGRVHPNPMLRAAIEIVTGIQVGPPRRPLDPITSSEREFLIALLKEVKLI